MQEANNHHENSGKKSKTIKGTKGSIVSRAKREREQMNQEMWVREREGLRDWLKRQNYNNN